MGVPRVFQELANSALADTPALRERIDKLIVFCCIHVRGRGGGDERPGVHFQVGMTRERRGLLDEFSWRKVEVVFITGMIGLIGTVSTCMVGTCMVSIVSTCIVSTCIVGIVSPDMMFVVVVAVCIRAGAIGGIEAVAATVSWMGAGAFGSLAAALSTFLPGFALRPRAVPSEATSSSPFSARRASSSNAIAAAKALGWSEETDGRLPFFSRSTIRSKVSNLTPRRAATSPLVSRRAAAAASRSRT